MNLTPTYRGGSLENVENTLEAFRRSTALDHPETVLELDVHQTKDGKIVVFHDESFKRMSGVEGTIRETNHVDLPYITNVPSEIAPDNLDRRIPELRELFVEFPNVAMQIDVKHGDKECVQKVGALITEFERERLTVWGSLSNTDGECFLTNKEIPFFMPAQHSMLSFLSWSVGLHWAFERWVDRERYACVIFPCVNAFLWKGWYLGIFGS
jgi:hypothetical protein